MDEQISHIVAAARLAAQNGEDPTAAALSAAKGFGLTRKDLNAAMTLALASARRAQDEDPTFGEDEDYAALRGADDDEISAASEGYGRGWADLEVSLG